MSAEDIQVVFGRRLRELRTAAGLSQETLASSARMTRAYLSELENARKVASIQTVSRLARALGVDASLLLTGGAAPVAKPNPPPRAETPAEKLARRIARLAQDTKADARSIKGFETIAKVYFRKR